MPSASRADDPFFAAVVDAVENDRLTLPTLPEVALRIREQCESPETTDAQLATELARDPAMAARVLRVANSAAQGAGVRADSLQKAVTRLGRDLTRLLVTGFALEQAFDCRSPELRMRLRSVWRQSLEVAAMARALALQCTRLKPDLAMLAGLIQDIGALALIRTADREAPPAPDVLEAVLEQFGPRAGTLVLKTWNFPPELLNVPVQAVDFERWHEGAADYADVVSVALLQGDAIGARRWWSVDRARVPALARLGLGPGADAIERAGVGERYAESAQLLAA